MCLTALCNPVCAYNPRDLYFWRWRALAERIFL